MKRIQKPRNIRTTRGVVSSKPAKTYKKSQRVKYLPDSAKLEAQKIGKDLVTTVQMLVDDRIYECPILKAAVALKNDGELEMIQAEILKSFKQEVKEMSSF